MSWNDKRIETIVGLTLRIGVMIAAAAVLSGGILFMIQNPGPRPDYQHFRGEPARLISPVSIMHGVAVLDARSVIMLGLLLLIATPVARVALCVVGFLAERDKLYVGVSAIVLGILVYSLFFH